jgi:EAL domain-containing protein (putative c-di-GMP-specific phosphodiesterase class I)
VWTNAMHDLLEPMFQPIADRSGTVYAYEALLRFRGAADSSPLSIVKRWEKSGFIRVLDKAMLDSVSSVTKAAAWRPRLAVNVSITTIESDGAAYLAELQRLAGRARRLIVELTETAPVRDASAVLRFAAACRASGFSVALDDCSPTHPYGSAAFLNNMRPELVKIDGAFLQESFRSGDVQPLRELIDAAHHYRAGVIAEHVSTEALREFALFLGVNFVQGYAIGKPAPLPSGAAARAVSVSMHQI